MECRYHLGDIGALVVWSYSCSLLGDVSSNVASCKSTPTGMSSLHRQESPAKLHLPSLRHRPNLNVEDQTDIMRPHRKKPISPSLDSIRISPRAQTMAPHSRRASDTAERDEVQLSLLSREHEPAHDDAVSFGDVYKKNKTLSVKDRKAMALLIVLCPSTPSHHLSSVAHPPQTSFKEFQ